MQNNLWRDVIVSLIGIMTLIYFGRGAASLPETVSSVPPPTFVSPSGVEHAVAQPMSAVALPPTKFISASGLGHAAPAQILPMQPTKRLLWGAYAGASPSDVTAFETLVGARVDLVATFYGWYDKFPLHYGSLVRDEGKTLVIFWEQYGVTLDEITSGASDAYIRQFAEDARNYGGPVLLAPFHEMNGYWTPWSGVNGNNNAQKVVLAWQHVRDLFRDTPNVRFVWAVNSDSVPDTAANSIAAYYPGDRYVDDVAINGFNFGDPWMSFGDIFEKPLAELQLYRKPIYILSLASAEGPQKAAWITDALSIAIPRHPEIVGWIWFNEKKEADWTVNSDPNALAEFQNALRHQNSTLPS